jgi:serine/threonine protein kinase
MRKEDFPQIPGYLIKRRLGEGGMANVFLALQENLGREVAIKVLDSAFLEDKQTLKRFEIEARSAAKLTNPNIVTIYDVGQSGDNHYIAMEYLEKSLRDRIKAEGKLPPQEALEIIKKISAALAEAHDKNIIHRDIKPDNIMFRRDGNPVLLDFGIARAMDIKTRLTMTGVNVGTPHYMSPEQCKGDEIDGRSDIYSLGIVLFESLTGKVPYTSEYITGVIYKHTHGQVAKLPAELETYQPLIEMMMAKQTENRVKSAAELVEYLQTPEEIQIPVKRKRVSIWVPAIAIFLILLGYIFIGTSLKERKGGPGETEIVAPNVLKKGNQDGKEQEPKQPQKPVNSLPDRSVPGDEKPVKKKIESEKKTAKTALEKKQKEGGHTSGKKEKVNPKEKQEKSEEIKIEVKTVNFVDLSRETIAAINEKTKRIEIENVEPGIIAGGEILLRLSVDEKGHVRIEHLDIARLIVTPEKKREQVKEMILKRIGRISLDLPKDDRGEPRFIKNWRKTYKLGTFQGRIILY